MWRKGDKLDESRILCGPRGVSVYLPPRPPEQAGDLFRDFPPGDPPQIHYDTVAANYWVVLREGRMRHMGRTKIFSEEVMLWLRAIEEDIESLIRNT